MTWLSYIRAVVGEFVLLLVCSWALEVVVMDGFYVTETLQFGPVPPLVSAVLLAVLYATAFKQRYLLPGAIITAVLIVAVLAASLVLSDVADVYTDAYGSWFWAAVVLVVVTVGGFLLTRTLVGSGIWFIVCIFSTALVQMMFETGRLGLSAVVLFTSLALLVYRNFRVGQESLDSAVGVSNVANLVVATVPVAALMGIACVVWFAVIAPLSPGVIDAKLIVEYRRENIEQVRGVGNVQMNVNTEMTSDQLVDGDRFTTDDLLVDEQADTAISAKALEQAGSPSQSNPDDETGGADSEGEAAGSREALDRDSTDSVWDAVSYTQQVPLALIIGLSLALIALVIAMYFLLRRWHRQKRLERMVASGDAGDQVKLLYLFLLKKLAILGFAVPSGTTLAEFTRDTRINMEQIRLETRVPFSVLTDTYLKVAYGAYVPTEEEVAVFVAYYLRFWKAARSYLGNFRYFFRSFRLG